MIKDYHIHPTVVQDPTRFARFAQAAIDRGFEEVCITDHMPLIGSGQADRIPLGCVEQYCRRVRELAKEWEGRLSVKLGIEADYHPQLMDQLERVLGAGDFDFILGSVHLQSTQSDIFDRTRTRNAFARASLETVLESVKSGYFHAVAHIDFYRWIFTRPHKFPLADDGFRLEEYLPLVEEILNAMLERNMLLELNTHFAVQTGDLSGVYPDAPIVQMALAKGVRFCFGSDAHESGHVGEMLEALRAHPVYAPALRTWEQE